MDGMLSALITMLIIFPIIFVPVVRNFNKKVKQGYLENLVCHQCGYRGNHQDEFDNHKKLTLHSSERVTE